ncbi:MAG: DUF2141 domain-containing protein [Cyclobacteriaceae bacterium]
MMKILLVILLTAVSQPGFMVWNSNISHVESSCKDSSVAESFSLQIHFENIRFTEGQLIVGIYKDAESWKLRKPSREILVSKAQLTNGLLTTKIDGLAPGNYGLAVLDDANGNEIVDFGWIFPKEGFGFSNYYHDTLRLPRYEGFAFDLKADMTVKVKFRYLKTL